MLWYKMFSWNHVLMTYKEPKMPNINLPINDLLATAERPIIFDVVKKVMDLTRISSKTQLRYFGEDAKAAQWNSTLDQNNQFNNLWPVVENLTIEVEEDFNTDRMLSMAVKTDENPYIFYDRALNIYIKPVKSPTNITIRFKYKAKDRNQAIRWRNEIRTRTAMNRDINMHELTYSYHLPEAYLDVLEDIWKLREHIGGYGDTYPEWFKKCSNGQMTIVTNLAGKQPHIVVAERQAEVQGWFDWEGAPEKPEKDGDEGMFTISFSYKFIYDKPINTVFNYPIVIHQQILPKKYRFSDPAYSVQALWKQYSQSGMAFSQFMTGTQLTKSIANKGLTIPAFDQYIETSTNVPSCTLRVFTLFTIISPTDRTTLFNLGDLGDFNIDADILAFMKNSEYSHMTTSYASIFCLNLYEDENVMADGILSVDSNLNVAATSPLDLRKTYRIRLSLVCDMSYLTSSALSRIKRNPVIRTKLVEAINAAVSNGGNDPYIRKNKLLPYDYSLIGLPNGYTPNPFTALVQTLFIPVDRLSNIPIPKVTLPTGGPQNMTNQ